ncbi:MAG: restriction endonuclease subunit S [bacterium]
MSAWKTVPLGELTQPKQWPTLSKVEMHAAGYTVYGANGRIGFTDTFTHEKPTILIGCRGSCGTVHVTEPRSYATGNAMALDGLDEFRVDIGFLVQFFRFRGFRDVTTGTSQPQIIRQNLVRVDIPLPPLEEQRRIAEVLDRAEALRAKRRAALAQFDTLTQAIFLDLFGDPVVNPKGWTVRKFGSVGTLDRGVSKHRPRNTPELLGGQYPLVQTGEVANCDGYICAYHSTYSEVGLRQSKMWPAGTLCITIAANIARTGILTFDACFPDSIVGFRSDEPATVEFVRTWLSFLQKRLEETAPESAQKNINLAILRNLDVPVPPLPLQREFARRVAAVDKLKAAHRASLAEMDALFASLQHRAFRGEL